MTSCGMWCRVVRYVCNGISQEFGASSFRLSWWCGQQSLPKRRYLTAWHSSRDMYLHDERRENFVPNFFLAVWILCIYDRALWTVHKRDCSNTRTCKYRLAVACNHLHWWPSRVNVHTCTVILLYPPISNLHKSFLLHNSSCLFQSLMMIIIREQHCMCTTYMHYVKYSIHADVC
jgi:hypothetical protein